nr:exocyst complex component EXO70A1-like [Tanacetum cinerariifolium]
ILQCLTVYVPGNDGISQANVKERFKTFNTQFEELHQCQYQWSVPDSELRESLRLAVDEVLLPAYRSYRNRFGPMIEGCKYPSKYIRFTPEDLERILAEEKPLPNKGGRT